jgi:prevent-host-death family protein
MDEMSIEQARPKLGEIVDRARFNNIHTAITRQGKTAAVVVSVEFYEYALDACARPRMQDKEGERS